MPPISWGPANASSGHVFTITPRPDYSRHFRLFRSSDIRKSALRSVSSWPGSTVCRLGAYPVASLWVQTLPQLPASCHSGTFVICTVPSHEIYLRGTQGDEVNHSTWPQTVPGVQCSLIINVILKATRTCESVSICSQSERMANFIEIFSLIYWRSVYFKRHVDSDKEGDFVNPSKNKYFKAVKIG